MFMQLFLGVLLLMAEQVGVQSGARIGLHSHLNMSQGGILNEYSRYGAYKRFYRTGAGIIHTSGGLPNSTGVIVPNPMVLIKSLRIDETRPGQCILHYTYACGGGGIDHVDAQAFIYRAGALFWTGAGPNHGAGPTVITENYDNGFIAGDLIQVWGRAYVAGDTCDILVFDIEYDWRIPGFGDGTFNNLNTALPVSDIDELLHTEIL